MSAAFTGRGALPVSSRAFLSRSPGPTNAFNKRSRTTRTFDGRGGIPTESLPSQLGLSESRRNSYSKQRANIPRMPDCRTLEEAIEANYDHLDILSPRQVAAFWAVVPRFLQKRGRTRLANEGPQRGQRGRHDKGRQMRQQFDEILRHTIKEIRSYGFRDLAQTTLAFAKIVKNVGVDGKNMPNDSPRRILQNLMIGTNSENKNFIFQEVTLASMTILGKFDARHLSNLIYAFGLAGYVHEYEDGSTSFDALAHEALPKLKKFNGQNFSNMLLAYAYVRVSNSQLFKKAGDVIERGDLETFTEQAIANIVWAYAKVDEPHPKLFKKVADHILALSNLRGFKTQNLSNIVWAFATSNELHPKLFKKVADHIVALNNLGGFKSQELSNIVWAFATSNERHPKLFKRVAEHITAFNNLGGFKPQDFSNIVWAFATSNELHPKLFKKVAEHIVALNNLGGFKPQGLSNIVWAFATSNELHPKLFKKVADHIVALNNLGGFKPQELSNIVWAFATSDELHPKLFKKVAEHIVALNNLGGFKPQGLSNIVWAFATSNERHPKLFKKVAEHIVALNDLGDFKPQNLSNIVWAFATAKESYPALFRKLGESAIQRRAEFNSQEFSNFLWAHAANGHVEENLFHTFAPVAESLIDKCNEQNLANIAWAYAVANVSASSLFKGSFIEACKNKEHGFSVAAFGQLHQWQMWQEELMTNISLHPSLCEKCHKAFVSTEIMSSALQDDVISELKGMGLSPKEEVLTRRGYRLDAVVEVDGNRIAIEVDGPSHFLGRRPTGSTMLKRRQVYNVEGIPIASVPYWEWNKLRKDSDKKQMYLHSLLGLSQA